MTDLDTTSAGNREHPYTAPGVNDDVYQVFHDYEYQVPLTNGMGRMEDVQAVPCWYANAVYRPNTMIGEPLYKGASFDEAVAAVDAHYDAAVRRDKWAKFMAEHDPDELLNHIHSAADRWHTGTGAWIEGMQ
jgi:hypothetical protein